MTARTWEPRKSQRVIVADTEEFTAQNPQGKKDSASPEIRPKPAATTPAEPTSTIACRIEEPSAMRMPISRVRCTIRFETNP